MNPGRKTATKCWPPCCAAAVLGVVMLVTMAADYSHGRRGSEWKLQEESQPVLLTAGFSLAKSAAGKRHVLPPAKRAAVSLRHKPTGTLTAAGVNRAARPPEITVSKAGLAAEIDRKASKASWHFLTRSVRRQIDAADVAPHRWKVMVIHSSATPNGSAHAFDYYHRQIKHMEHGLAYHFVIGNGKGSGDGQVEVGPRWDGQIAGGHLRSETQNEIAIGICLVGNFEKTVPTRRQLEALDELIDYLQAKVGKISVTTHRRINIRPTLCPGKNFPAGMFVEG